MAKPYKWVCVTCGSDKIILEAEAAWDTATQSFSYSLADQYDRDYCCSCEEYKTMDNKDLTDLKDIALVAAHTPIFKSVRSNPDADCVHR